MISSPAFNCSGIFFPPLLNVKFAPSGLSVVDSSFILRSQQVIKNIPVYLLCLELGLHMEGSLSTNPL